MSGSADIPTTPDESVSPNDSVSGSADSLGGSISERFDSGESEPVMSFGDHLEELRFRCVLGLAGIVVATLISFFFSKRIMGLVLQPAMAVLKAHGQPTVMQQLSPADSFLTFLKMAILCGLILAMPWILWQIWRFVSTGLYRNEQRFLKLFAPLSIGLFLSGVLFMYFVVLPVVLNFFVAFGETVTVKNMQPVGLQRFLIGAEEDNHNSNEEALDNPVELNWSATIPVTDHDPTDPPIGAEWINTQRRTRCVMTPEGVLESPLQHRNESTVVRSQFGLNYYISFVLTMTLAFGVAFELPLVVLFLTGTGLVTTGQLGTWRRYVILGIVVTAAMLTPPDILSQILLAVPMILLFEGALVASKLLNKSNQNSTGSEGKSTSV